MHKCVSKKLYSLHWMTPIHTLVKFFFFFSFNFLLLFFFQFSDELLSFMKFFVWRKISKKNGKRKHKYLAEVRNNFWKKERDIRKIKIIKWWWDLFFKFLNEVLSSDWNFVVHDLKNSWWYENPPEIKNIYIYIQIQLGNNFLSGITNYQLITN